MKLSNSERERLLEKFNCGPPASQTSLHQFEAEARAHLPEDYVQFLQRCNGGEGFIGKAYLILWPVEELVKMNKAYEVEEYASGVLIFGSNGGGEAFAFDMRSDTKPIVSLPFVGMDLKEIL